MRNAIEQHSGRVKSPELTALKVNAHPNYRANTADARNLPWAGMQQKEKKG